MKNKRVIMLFLLCLLVLTGAGCGKAEENESAIETVSLQSSMQLYYLSRTDSGLIAVEYTPEALTIEDQAREVLLKLTYAENGLDTDAPLAGEIGIKDLYMDGKRLVVDFENTYSYIETSREILVRGALVKSLTQIPGVESVLILVDSEPYTDADGLEVGPLSADSFVFDINF